MSDRRKRIRNRKQQGENISSAHIILAKRNDDRQKQQQQQQQQQQRLQHPKILIKSRETVPECNSGTSIKTFIIKSSNDSIIRNCSPNRSDDTTVSGNALDASCTTQLHTLKLNQRSRKCSEQTDTDNCSQQTSEQTITAEPLDGPMTEPVTLFASSLSCPNQRGSSELNLSVQKLLLKNYSNFVVAGVIGMQGVGKSTVLNLLARNHIEHINYDDFFEQLFIKEAAHFSTKLKHYQRSRTEVTEMFITNERLILLDTPPLLFNGQKKEFLDVEIDDLLIIINMLSICHLLIIVMDQYFSIDLIRLICLAMEMKPLQLSKAHVENYLPRVLFVRNRATRLDYMPDMQKSFHAKLQYTFGKTDLNIFHEKSLKHKNNTNTQLNCIFLPEFKSAASSTYHPSLGELHKTLRELVLYTSYNKMYLGNEFYEIDWFNTVSKVLEEGAQNFKDAYCDVMQQHFEFDDDTSNSGDDVASMPTPSTATGTSSPPPLSPSLPTNDNSHHQHHL